MTAEIIDSGIYQALVELVGEDFIDEMVDAFLTEGAQFLADLSHALDAQDVDLLRRSAHSLKSNAATFGAHTLSELAKEVEIMARENQLAKMTGKFKPLSIAFEQASQTLKDLQNG